MEGPSSFRVQKKIGRFFKDCSEYTAVPGFGMDMCFSRPEHWAMFVPIVGFAENGAFNLPGKNATDVPNEILGIIEQLRQGQFATYHYTKNNCHKFVGAVLNKLCSGEPELFSLLMKKLISGVHTYYTRVPIMQKCVDGMNRDAACMSDQKQVKLKP